MILEGVQDGGQFKRFVGALTVGEAWKDIAKSEQLQKMFLEAVDDLGWCEGHQELVSGVMVRLGKDTSPLAQRVWENTIFGPPGEVEDLDFAVTHFISEGKLLQLQHLLEGLPEESLKSLDYKKINELIFGLDTELTVECKYEALRLLLTSVPDEAKETIVRSSRENWGLVGDHLIKVALENKQDLWWVEPFFKYANESLWQQIPRQQIINVLIESCSKEDLKKYLSLLPANVMAIFIFSVEESELKIIVPLLKFDALYPVNYRSCSIIKSYATEEQKKCTFYLLMQVRGHCSLLGSFGEGPEHQMREINGLLQALKGREEEYFEAVLQDVALFNFFQKNYPNFVPEQIGKKGGFDHLSLESKISYVEHLPKEEIRERLYLPYEEIAGKNEAEIQELIVKKVDPTFNRFVDNLPPKLLSKLSMMATSLQFPQKTLEGMCYSHSFIGLHAICLPLLDVKRCDFDGLTDVAFDWVCQDMTEAQKNDPAVLASRVYHHDLKGETSEAAQIINSFADDPAKLFEFCSQSDWLMRYVLVLRPELMEESIQRIGGMNALTENQKVALLPRFTPNQIKEMVDAYPKNDEVLNKIVRFEEAIGTPLELFHIFRDKNLQGDRDAVLPNCRSFLRGFKPIELACLAKSDPELLAQFIPFFEPHELAVVVPYIPYQLIARGTLEEVTLLVKFATLEQKEPLLQAINFTTESVLNLKKEIENEDREQGNLEFRLLVMPQVKTKLIQLARSFGVVAIGETHQAQEATTTTREPLPPQLQKILEEKLADGISTVNSLVEAGKKLLVEKEAEIDYPSVYVDCTTQERLENPMLLPTGTYLNESTISEFAKEESEFRDPLKSSMVAVGDCKPDPGFAREIARFEEMEKTSFDTFEEGLDHETCYQNLVRIATSFGPIDKNPKEAGPYKPDFYERLQKNFKEAKEKLKTHFPILGKRGGEEGGPSKKKPRKE